MVCVHVRMAFLERAAVDVLMVTTMMTMKMCAKVRKNFKYNNYLSCVCSSSVTSTK